MTKSEILSILKKYQHDFYQKYGVTKIGLFGSYARETQNKNSDIDLVIEMEKGKKSLKNFFGFKRELENVFRKNIDLGIESSLKPIVKEQIKKEILYV